MSSFKLGKNVRAKFCRYRRCSDNDFIDVTGPYITEKMANKNDWVSYIYLYPYNEADINQSRVTFFKETDLNCGDCQTFTMGEYINSDIDKGMGIDKDDLKALRIPDGLTV